MSKNILNLALNERIILNLLSQGNNTPLLLSKKCAIPRPTIYLTLRKLVERGLARSVKVKKRYHWEQSSEEYVKSLYEQSVNGLFKTTSLPVDMPHDYSSIANVHIHKGKNSIVKIFLGIIKQHESNRMVFIQGDNVGDSWTKNINPKEIDRVNKLIKERGLITETITSEKWFRLQAKIFGQEWVRNFEGRSAQFNILDSAYLDHDCYTLLFKNSVYLIDMPDDLVIEIKNKRIVKMIRQIFNFIQDNTRKIDGNALLREIISSNSN